MVEGCEELQLNMKAEVHLVANRSSAHLILSERGGPSNL